jgi:UDP-glucose 4-epimerase
MTPSTTTLVTGGAGYIGAHTTLALLQAGHAVVVLDNLSNSSAESLRRVERIAGRAPVFVQGDVRDRALVEQLLRQHGVGAVLHFAGLKAVGESVSMPLAYYDHNVAGSLALCQAMAAAGVWRLVFSSSATVYGDPATVPIHEDMPTGPTNPYGRTKWMVEHLLRDVAASDTRWSIAALRYFNPVGAHDSGLIGEDPRGTPNNLLPYVAQVAVGRRAELAVFGDDYPTPDGTGVRDYIHVVDLADGHLKALQALQARSGLHTWNLGTGRGHSVLEIVRAFEQASGRPVPYHVVPRRPGDVATSYADPTRATRELGWQAQRGLPEMMADTWRWQSANPQGYGGD